MTTENSRIPAEEWKELADFWRQEGDALSLYFKPPAPATELAHRQDVIHAKDKIKEALGRLHGSSVAHRSDVERVLERVAAMKDNGGRARVIFACARQGLWRQYDIPGDFALRLDVGCSFTLAPLAAEQESRRFCIALADRNRARLLLLENREITEHSHVLDEDDKEKIRTTGAGKSVHLERKNEEKVRKHFSFLADHLLHFFEHRDYDALIFGCRDETWPDIEAELHPQLRSILAGRFSCDPGLATCEEIQEKAQAIIDRQDREEEEQLVERTLGGAAANALGAVGLQAVMDALEKGEVRTLLWADAPQADRRGASMCENCAHLEAEAADACALCGARLRRYVDAHEALLRHALGRSIAVRRVRYAKLPPPDAIAAWLRFRAEMNTAQALAS